MNTKERIASTMYNSVLWGAGAGIGLYAHHKLADRIDDMCERCPNEGRSHDLCGGCVSAKICLDCVREYQSSPDVRRLYQEQGRQHIIASAHMYNGAANDAAIAISAKHQRDDDLFAFTMTWLAEPVPRAGKTRADRIAAWEADQAERSTAKRTIKRRLAEERGLPNDDDQSPEPSEPPVGSGG